MDASESQHTDKPSNVLPSESSFPSSQTLLSQVQTLADQTMHQHSSLTAFQILLTHEMFIKVIGSYSNLDIWEFVGKHLCEVISQ